MIAIVLESRRPAKQQNKAWIERQQQKLGASVAELSRELEEKSWCNGESYTLADIATGCALGYLDLRNPDLDWRRDYPNLARLAEKRAKRPSFHETEPPAA